MKKLFILIAIAVLYLSAILSECWAQTQWQGTNSYTIVTNGQQSIVYAMPYPDSTSADWAKALGDVGIHVNVTSIGSVLFLVYFGAKIIRNKTSLGNTPLGNFLSSVLNAESAPQQPAQPPKV